jgi:sugar lactone lactonase YvrE
VPIPTTIVATLSDTSLTGPAGLAFDAARTRLLVARPVANTVAWSDVSAATPVFATVGAFGTNPAMAGFSAPVAIAVDAAGYLFVLDSGNNEIDGYQLAAGGGSYTYDSTLLGGARSSFAGQTLAQATDVALSGGVLYILDAGNTRVVSVNLANATATVAVTDSSWSQPSGLAVTAGGTLFVADTFNHRVRRYAAGGGTPSTIGSYGTGTGQLRLPRALAVDSAGNLFVADSGNNRVQVFDTTGASVGVIGSSAMFGAIKGLAFDAAGLLYVSDSARHAIYVFGSAPAGPIIRVAATPLDYGSVGVGYAFDRPLAIHNDGSAPLAVSNIVSSNSRFIPVQATVQVPAGAMRNVLVRFAPSASGSETGTLTLTSNSTSGPTTGIVVRGTGITPALVDAVLVLDRSGSMWANIGTQSKMAALQSASKLFVDLARAGLGDRIGIVDFDHVATTDMALTPVTDVAPSSRTAARNAIDVLAPRGLTSIGGGLEQARAAFNAAGGTGRKALLLVTDGIENTPPFVKGGAPSDPRVDLTLYSGITMYTVGLGLGVEVDLGVLTSLASTFRGSFYLTEDQWLTLPKFFIEIFADTIDEFVTLDPEFELNGPLPVEIDVNLGRVDTGFTFALFWQDRTLALDFRLVTPAGTTIDAAVASAHPSVRYSGGSGYAFYRATLPLVSALGGAWDGTWKLLVSAPLAAGTKARFGMTALVSSNLGITCGLERDSDSTGESVTFEARLSEYGLAIEPDAISLEVDAPAYSRGDLLAGVKVRTPVDAPADYGPPALRERLTWGIQHDPRFRERRLQKLQVTTARDGDAVVLGAVLPQVALEGSYHYRFVAEIDRGGLRLRRECAHSFAALAYPAAETTDIALVKQGTSRGRTRYQLMITPRDIVGNLIGPGLDADLRVTADRASMGRVKDGGDGTYAVELSVPQGREKAVRVRAEIRQRVLEWTWRDLTAEPRRNGGKQPLDPPRTWPRS